VLKVPARKNAAAAECCLWEAVKSFVPTASVFLVPVRHVVLDDDAVHEVRTGVGRSDRTFMREGVLMPAYAGTLARVPVPADEVYADAVIARLEPTLRFLHVQGWLHGDVKPSNVFLDFAGGSWLGDFGTSVPHAVAADSNFAGGTPAFQCDGISAAAAPLHFDLVGLAISVLVLVGLLDIAVAPWGGWPRDALDAAAARVRGDALRAKVQALLRGEAA